MEPQSQGPRCGKRRWARSGACEGLRSGVHASTGRRFSSQCVCIHMVLGADNPSKCTTGVGHALSSSPVSGELSFTRPLLGQAPAAVPCPAETRRRGHPHGARSHVQTRRSWPHRATELRNRDTNSCKERDVGSDHGHSVTSVKLCPKVPTRDGKERVKLASLGSGATWARGCAIRPALASS